eukprot:2142022-Pyramimonas_sp.AAC.1
MHPPSPPILRDLELSRSDFSVLKDLEALALMSTDPMLSRSSRRFRFGVAFAGRVACSLQPAGGRA